jgi:hypothetical protein
MDIQLIRNATLRITKQEHVTFDFDTVSRADLRALAEAEGIGANRLLIPNDGDTLAF